MPGRRLAARIGGAAAGIAALFGAAGTARAQSVAPAEAPAAWVRYADATTVTVSAWLAEEGAPAERFRAYLNQTRPGADQPVPPLDLKLWIAADGRIERIDFAPFAYEAANADLRAALVGRALPAPPRDMLLPLRLRVEMKDAPAETATS